MGGLSPQQSLSLYDVPNPFQSAASYRTSNYSAVVDGQLVRLLDWREPSGQARMLDHQLRSFMTNERFSCVAGKAVVRSGGYRFGCYEGFPSGAGTHGLARDLAAFVAELPFIESPYASFIAVFLGVSYDERSFESGLWEQLARLHELDARYFPWAPTVSKDPDDARFAFSFALHPFFVVGMHPAASRISRRFAVPALAFNSHAQFDRLKADGRFERIMRLVRERERALQGRLNPNLSAFGEASEARQYAGRAVEGAWQCPFHPPS
jgi:FPC/CPF motif-containing protein YcgG